VDATKPRRDVWGPLALRGGITVALGLALLVWPRLVVGLLVLLVGSYAVVKSKLVLMPRESHSCHGCLNGSGHACYCTSKGSPA
jgi:hypothetical protein